MTNLNKYIHPVQPSLKPQKFSSPNKLKEKSRLQKKLIKKGINIKLGEILKGGTVSQVYAAKLDGQAVVVKHTEDLTPFDPTEFFISKQGHNIDTKVLKLLQKSNNIKVPQILHHFPKITTTIMADTRVDGYQLLSDLILSKKLPLNSAEKIGTQLANLAQESRKWKKFKTNESTQQSIYERGLELRMMYPSTQTEYLKLERQFTQNNKYWTWPDGHPKNMLVNSDGEVIFIDFGRSHWGDQAYMLPNFLAHIIIYTLTGHIKPALAKNYIKICFCAYQHLESVDQPLFYQYLGMEVLHRSFGKWLEGIDTQKNKLNLANFGLTIFDQKINSLEKLLKIISLS